MALSQRSWIAVLALAACGDNLEGPEPKDPLAASVEVEVEVPAGMTAPPFEQPRKLMVPPGFGIRVIARIPTARFLAETPEGDLLVSKPGEIANVNGEIYKVSSITSTPTVSTLATGLTLSHDLVFTQIAGTTYLYVSETHRVSRTVWSPTATTLTLDSMIDDLPSQSLPELMGNYGHALKNIAIAGDRLYVSIASATNSSPSDVLADPIRGSIYVYGLEGGPRRLYAQGIRNAEGLAIHPKTGELWVATNHRDNIRYPFRDGKHPFGELVQEYVNDNPPEPFNRVRDGGNYGWPYCNPYAAETINNMPYVPDIDNNDGETVLDCDSIDRIDKGLPAHSAPLGMSFWTGDKAPLAYRDGAVIGLHGCWNCSEPRGYKVVYLEPRADDGFKDPIDLVTGFLTDPTDTGTVWGRPVDAIPAASGNLYISDDRAGAVYELYRK